MTQRELPAVADIGEFYDEMGDLIEVLGSNIHVGYWLDDDDPTPLLEAINRLTEIVGGKLDLKPGQHLIDVGCGMGIAAIRIAQRTDADVTGVTNSRWQAREGTRRASADGLRGQVRIEYGDAAALAYPDRTFDAALAFESLPHARDKGRWLREMARVLRPGGRLVLTEFEAEQPLTDQDVEVIRAGALEPPLPLAEFVSVIEDSGFVVEETVSCGEHIRRSYSAYLERVGRRRDVLVTALGEQRVDEHVAGMQVLLAVYLKIGYVIVTAHRAG